MEEGTSFQRPVRCKFQCVLIQEFQPILLSSKALSLNPSGSLTVRRGLLMPLYPATLQHVPRPIDEVRVLDCGQQLKNTLDAVHRRGYGHNDVKAGNVFLDQGGEIK